jgi:hypothetical protein
MLLQRISDAEAELARYKALAEGHPQTAELSETVKELEQSIAKMRGSILGGTNPIPGGQSE